MGEGLPAMMNSSCHLLLLLILPAAIMQEIQQQCGKQLKLAIKHNVAIGAHLSFFDRENFGRTEMNLARMKYMIWLHSN